VGPVLLVINFALSGVQLRDFGNKQTLHLRLFVFRMT
jgi:hypothetical protein